MHKKLKLLSEISIAAGAAIMRHRDLGGISVVKKADNSPVTAADEEANALIVAALLANFPDIPVVSEEGNLPDSRQLGDEFWLVDPLDGTRAFIRGDNDFTVNIGLIVRGVPQLGVIFLPATNELYTGAVGFGALCGENPIQTKQTISHPAKIILSQRHAEGELNYILKDYPDYVAVSASSSLKFCKVAEGSADIYPRLGPTMEWDTAAGHAILLAAGGSLTKIDGSVFDYAKPNFLNPGFIAKGN